MTALGRVTHASWLLTGHTDSVYGVAFSADGALLATASADRTVRLWNVATGQPHGAPLKGHTDAVRGVAFSADGTLLATASADRTVRLWNVATGHPHGAPLEGHTDEARIPGRDCRPTCPLHDVGADDAAFGDVDAVPTGPLAHLGVRERSGEVQLRCCGCWHASVAMSPLNRA